MEIPAKTDWPLTAQGVTDWEFVFENEEEGFIALVSMAHTPFIMKDCTTVIIQQLFSRDSDAMNIMKFIIALSEIVPDEKEQNLNADLLAAMRAEIVELLRKIKIDRIKSANDFLRRKLQEKKDRRSRVS